MNTKKSSRRRQSPEQRGRQPRRNDAYQSRVFSYHSSRTPAQANMSGRGGRSRMTRREKKNKRLVISGGSIKQAAIATQKVLRLMKWDIPIVIALIIIVIGIGMDMTVNSKPIIVVHGFKPGSQSPAAVHSIATYEETAQHIISSYWFDKFKVTFAQTSFVKRFTSDFPEVAYTDITLPILGHRPVVDISLNIPSLVLVSSGQSYVIDQDGKVIALAQNMKHIASLNLQSVSDQGGLHVALGDYVLSKAQVSYIRTVSAELSAEHVPVTSFTLPAVPYELDIHPVGVPYIVKLNMQLNARQSIGTYLAVRAHLLKNHTVPSSYVDVRVQGRAYYK